MKKTDIRLFSVIVLFFVVLYISFDFNNKLDKFNENSLKASSLMHQLELKFNKHLDVTKESIINLHFNNDRFDLNIQKNKKELELFSQYSYPKVLESYRQYTEELIKLRETTFQFIRYNAKVKNSLVILEMNLNQHFKVYDKVYLENFIHILTKFNSLKNEMKNEDNIDKELFDYFEKHSQSSLYKINSIHINVVYKNIKLFKSHFNKIKNSKVQFYIKQMKENFIKESQLIKDQLQLEFYLVLAICFVFFVVILILVYSLRKEFKTDKLTKLLNISAYYNDMPTFKNSSLILFDITDFNNINSITGFKSGDIILQKVSKIIQDFANEDKRSLNSVYRVGVDQFVLVTKSVQNQDSQDIAKELISKIENEVFKYDGLELPVYMQVGISNSSPYLKNAKLAMEKTKGGFEKISFYQESMNNKKDATINSKMLNKVKDALEEDRIKPYFQAIVDLKTKKAIKYEALVRLIDTNNKAISPYFFLELSKKSKLYTSITQVVILKSIEFIRNTQNDVSINLSYQDILDTKTVNFILTTLKENQDIANKITFELLESDEIENYTDLLQFVDFVKSFGVKLAIDDFGSGYSNFTHLFNMKPDIVKIDASLIKNLDTDENSKHIVQSLVALCQKSGIKTVAEFVDNDVVDAIVTDLDIDYGQGYLYAEPKDLLV